MPEVPNFTDDQWAELLDRLTHHALGKYRKCGWNRHGRGKLEWAGPDGASPEDVAQEAVNLVLGGQRKYDSATQPDFAKYMRSVVDSLISHTAEKAVGRRTGRIPLRTDGETGEMVEVEFPGAEPDPVEVCIADEVMELARDVVLRDAADDPLVQRLFECFEAGITKPAEVAECLEVDVREVNNAQKRFRRKLDQAFSGGKERQR